MKSFTSSTAVLVAEKTELTAAVTCFRSSPTLRRLKGVAGSLCEAARSAKSTGSCQHHCMDAPPQISALRGEPGRQWPMQLE